MDYKQTAFEFILSVWFRTTYTQLMLGTVYETYPLF